MFTLTDQRAGFTLIEALIALTILAGATASVMMMMGTNRWAQALTEADLTAALNARLLLARIGHDLPLEVGTHSGTFDNGQDWSVQITPYGREERGENARRTALLQIRIRLHHTRSRQASLDVFTLREASR